MKPRHHLYLDKALSARLDELAARPGSSKSAIVADALRAWLDRQAAGELDTMLQVRLDRLSRNLERIERDQEILLESLALFIRFHFTVIPSLPEAEQKAARVLGQDRFESFIEQVARRLAEGKRLSRQVLDRQAAKPEGGQ